MQGSAFVWRGFVVAGFAGVLAACANDVSAPTVSSSDGAVVVANEVSALAATIRVRCERRTGPNRSKISVDGNDLVPRNGVFRARVSASGGTVTSPTQRAVGDEAEFDFDSNRNDIAQGATPIPATFITARSGSDVIGEILNAQGQVVARQGVDCQFR